MKGSGGVYAGAQSGILFKADMELPSEWDTSIETVNVYILLRK